MSFKNFSVSDLEQLIGGKTLTEVAKILPAFDPDVDVDSIYKKSNLIKLLYSFYDSNQFSKKHLRTQYLLRQSDSTITDFCLKVEINSKLSFEEKVRLIVLKGWSDQNYCRLFCQHFDLPEKFIPQKKNTELNDELVNSPVEPYKILKDYQSVICYKAIKNLENRNTRFIIQMPTGSGKTRTAIEIITDCFNRNMQQCLIFWLVYSEELCEQAVECFQEIWRHVGTRPIKLVRAWGKNKISINEEDKYVFVVGGFQKIFNQYTQDSSLFSYLKEKTYLIVVDEAHRVLAPTYKKVTDSLFGSNSRLIGLTATPGRSLGNNNENIILSDYFYGEKIDIETPQDQSVFSYLKSRGIMSRVVSTVLETTPQFELTDRDIEYLDQHFDLPVQFVNQIGKNEIRNLEIIKELLTQLKTHKKALFFACSVEHSKFICSIVNYLGFNAAHVDGTTNRAARQTILKEFKNGDLQMICNYGILSTGFDAPKTDLVFISRPTQSIVLYSQMIGRGLRGIEVGGTEKCTIVTVKDNILGLPDEASIFTYFDDYFSSQ